MENHYVRVLTDSKLHVSVFVEDGQGGRFIAPTVVNGIGRALPAIPNSLVSDGDAPRFFAKFVTKEVIITIELESPRHAVMLTMIGVNGNEFCKPWMFPKCNFRYLQEYGQEMWNSLVSQSTNG